MEMRDNTTYTSQKGSVEWGRKEVDGGMGSKLELT